MTKEEMKTTAFYNVLRDTIKNVLIDNVGVLTDKLMPILEPFVEDRLEKLKQYDDVLKQATNPTIIIKKPQWSEEDERILYAIIADFKAFKYSTTSTLESHFDECLDWLKSLKKRMKE